MFIDKKHRGKPWWQKYTKRNHAGSITM